MAKVKKEAAKESLSLFNRGLEGLINTAQAALNSGVSKKAVELVTSPVRGARATVDTVKKADEKLIDLITRQKRMPSGQPLRKVKKVDDKFGRKTGVQTGSKKDTGYRVKRGTARAIVYGGPATVGTSKQMDKAANKAAEELKKEEAAKRANDQIDGLTAALNKKQTEKAKRAAEETAETKTTKGKGKGKLFPKFRPFGGVLARALLGDDERFGGERGAIDFIRTKKKKPVKKNMGGMMKKKGYAKGGAVKKVSKGSSSGGKRRGVGAAKRGFGKALR